jgi:sulfite exporter TauE/SafE
LERTKIVFTLIRLLTAGKPRVQIVVGSIIAALGLFILVAALADGSAVSGIIAGLFFVLMGALFILRGVRRLGSTKKPATYNASYMQQPAAQSPYMQPVQPAQPVYQQPAPYAPQSYPQQPNAALPYQDQ